MPQKYAVFKFVFKTFKTPSNVVQYTLYYDFSIYAKITAYYCEISKHYVTKFLKIFKLQQPDYYPAIFGLEI